MIQHPHVHGGNNAGEDESFPQQKDSNSSRNPNVNTNPPKSTPDPPPIGVPRTTYMSIFHKTHMCKHFEKGNCHYGDRCKFAHGSKDLSKLPPNWQQLVKDDRGWRDISDDDKKIIREMRICWRFFSGEKCTGGEKCNFLHENPAKFKVQTTPMEIGRTRKCSVLTVQTAVPQQKAEAEGFAKLVNKKVIGIYGDWIDDGEEEQVL